MTVSLVSAAPARAVSVGDEAPAALESAQRWLFQRVTRPLRLEPSPPSEDARWVLGGRAPSSERIAVYQRAFFARLVECLRDDYPALARAVGDDDFEARCLSFIEAHPPSSASLNFYGAPFAQHCATWASPLAAFFRDLARLEWAIVECIHAQAGPSLDPSALGALTPLDWSRARLVASAAFRILESDYPLHAYYSAYLADDEPAAPAPGASTLLVCRRDERVWRIPIDPRWTGLLRQLVAGEPMASAIAAAAAGGNEDQRHPRVEPVEDEPSVGAALQRTVSEWVACGLFTAVRIG